MMAISVETCSVMWCDVEKRLAGKTFDKMFEVDVLHVQPLNQWHFVIGRHMFCVETPLRICETGI
jgi:hypothetical protein